MYKIIMYNRKCKIKQYFKYYKYNYISFKCFNQNNCEKCAKNHFTSIKKNQHNMCNEENSNKYVACEKKHNAWNKICFIRKKNDKNRIRKKKTFR